MLGFYFVDRVYLFSTDQYIDNENRQKFGKKGD